MEIVKVLVLKNRTVIPMTVILVVVMEIKIPENIITEMAQIMVENSALGLHNQHQTAKRVIALFGFLELA
jgi:hypothetical protein